MRLISVSWMGRSSKAFSRQPDTVFVAPWNHKFTEMNTCQCEIQISVFGISFHVFTLLYGGKGKKPASSPPASTVLLSTGFRKSSSEDLLQVPLKMKDLLRIMTTDPPLIQALSQPFPRAFLQHLGSIYPPEFSTFVSRSLAFLHDHFISCIHVFLVSLSITSSPC